MCSSRSTLTSVADLEPGETYWVRVRAIDSSANVGPWTLPVSVATSDATGRDFTTNPIAAGELAVGIGGGNLLVNSSFEAGEANWLRSDDGEHHLFEVVGEFGYRAYTEGY